MARLTSKRYFAVLKGTPEPVPLEIEPLGDGRYAVTLNGQRHLIDACTLDHGAVSLIVDGTSHHVEFEDADDTVAVLVKNQVVRAEVVDERKLKLRAASAAFSVEGKQVVTAPMPGKVVKVMVKKGDRVEEGQGLLVVEAMKMENELKSPKAGQVIELFAIEGAAVENNAKLVVVE